MYTASLKGGNTNHENGRKARMGVRLLARTMLGPIGYGGH